MIGSSLSDRELPFRLPFLPGDRGVAQRLGAVHHGLQGFVVRLLVALEQRLHVLPPAGRRDVLERLVFPLRGPLPPVGMPQPALQFRELRVAFRGGESLVEQVPVHRRLTVRRACEHQRRAVVGPSSIRNRRISRTSRDGMGTTASRRFLSASARQRMVPRLQRECCLLDRAGGGEARWSVVGHERNGECEAKG